MNRIWAGIDSGKTHHHCVAIDQDGTERLSRRVPNGESELLQLLQDVFAIASRPEVWMLSSSARARTAGELGLGYAFAGFINPDGAAHALLRHSAWAQPAAHGPAGRRSILAVGTVVANTDTEAQRLAWPRTALLAHVARTGSSALVPTVEEAARELVDAEKETPTVITDGRWPRQIAGIPTTVRDQIEQMTKATGVDEVMVQDMIADPQTRAHSRALLAQALGVAPDRAAAA
ncbi:LLM class flavin-dependent oxidoreductase [Streptomyces sp. NPDC058394]|uniref:LLM class flavin-dependent oxidoreductase n=1 Tax=unclassified Streptomyces TaxID=2593676 RepID=UPI00365A27C0